MKKIIDVVIPMVDLCEPLRRLSGELLTFPDREAARRYAVSLPGPPDSPRPRTRNYYMASWRAINVE